MSLEIFTTRKLIHGVVSRALNMKWLVRTKQLRIQFNGHTLMQTTDTGAML